MPGDQWFIDETKASGLKLVVVSASSASVGRCRAQMSKMPRRAGGYLHFTKEIDATRAEALRLIAAMPLTVTVVTVPSGVRAVEARERAVRWVARAAAANRVQRLVFELDAAVVANERRWLRAELARTDVEYSHLGKTGDPMLWIADGIAWAVHRGGTWRAMVDHLIIETVTV